MRVWHHRRMPHSFFRPIFAWVASLIIYRYARLDELEVTPTRS